MRCIVRQHENAVKSHASSLTAPNKTQISFTYLILWRPSPLPLTAVSPYIPASCSAPINVSSAVLSLLYTRCHLLRLVTTDPDGDEGSSDFGQ